MATAVETLSIPTEPLVEKITYNHTEKAPILIMNHSHSVNSCLKENDGYERQD